MESVLSYSFKLFLQGIEIPFISADIQFSNRSHFNIEIPPVDEVNKIKPGTHAIIAFKRRESDDKWHLLCEGFYTGPYYSKQASNRSLRLRFRDVQWFAENATIYNLMPNAENERFALDARAFYGDASLPLETDDEGDVIPSTVNFTARFQFLSALNESDDPLHSMFQSIFGWLSNGNKFIKTHTNGWHMDGGRVYSVENKQMSEIYTRKMINDSFKEILGQSTNLTNVMDVMLMLMQMVHYDLMPIPCMSVASSLASYVSKPHLHLMVPPACNVIFPDETINFGFNVDYSLRPTRLWFRGAMNNSTSRGYIAPDELNDLQDPHEVTTEEMFQGIRGQESRLPFAYTKGSPAEGDDADAENLFEKQFASYMYYDQKYESTPMNLTCAFRPDLLPGFPVLVLDRIIPMIGYLININHSVDLSSGAAYTSMTLTHVRPVHEKTPILAGWYDRDQFTPDHIGSHVYERLGTKAYWKAGFLDDDTPPSTDDDMVDNSDAVNNLIEKYKEVLLQGDDYQEFKESFFRELPVFYDESTGLGAILDALNLTWKRDESPEKLEGSEGPNPLSLGAIDGDFRRVDTERREAIERLSKTLSTVEGLWTPTVVEEGDDNAE